MSETAVFRLQTKSKVLSLRRGGIIYIRTLGGITDPIVKKNGAKNKLGRLGFSALIISNEEAGKRPGTIYSHINYRYTRRAYPYLGRPPQETDPM